jgi:thiamine-monophosphate kinase
MGGTPDLALITLALPADFLVDDAIALYQGVREAATAFDITLGGGDIVRSPVFSITVALSGIAETPKLGETAVMTRGAARIGDVIAVSGNVGDSAGGLRLLQSESYSNSEAARHLRVAHIRPNPRLVLGKAAVESGVRCAIDVSDGLLQDLGHIARASNAAIRIDAARVPISDALHEVFPGRALGIALTGGEDYELVLAGPRPVIEALIDRSETPLTEIGEVIHHPEAPRVAVVDETGLEIPLGNAGWDHFRNP